MKLSQKDRRALTLVLAELKRGHSFIMAPDTAIMRKHRLSSVDFYHSDFPPYAGEKWGKICKETGSEWVVALSAVRTLENLLDPRPLSRP